MSPLRLSFSLIIDFKNSKCYSELLKQRAAVYFRLQKGETSWNLAVMQIGSVGWTSQQAK